MELLRFCATSLLFWGCPSLRSGRAMSQLAVRSALRQQSCLGLALWATAFYPSAAQPIFLAELFSSAAWLLSPNIPTKEGPECSPKIRLLIKKTSLPLPMASGTPPEG